MDENEFNIEEVTSSEDILQLMFSGNLNINNANKIHTYFQNNCIEPQELILNFENAESLDLSIIQIISALLMKRKGTEKQTETNFNSDSAISELLLKSGMLDLIERLQNNKA